jgi:hypothetical protein
MNPRQDRSWVVKFETRELNGDEVKVLADNFQGEGWLVFKPNSDGILAEEIPTSSADAGVKSQAQRLRGAIMVLWRNRGSKGDPEAFYRTFTEKLIEYTLTKIEETE